MFNIIIKTFIVYVLIVFAMRIMGKKQAGQLQPYELVITLIIAEVASTPMDSPGTPLLYGLVPAVTLLLIYSFFSYICLKSKRMRLLLCGRPNILIHNGRLLAGEIRRIGYSLNDLTEQLRINGTTNIANIQYAILETNGQLSVLPYAAFCPATPSDLAIDTAEGSLCSALVLDGKFHDEGILRFGADPKKIRKYLHTMGFNHLKQVFIFTLSDNGDVFIQDMDGNVKTARLGEGGFAHA
ncbi:MAG: DUF421 domain-containing protein [Christensenellaceae bacterium]|nr:DUF421 domain-containing protein [Christensenellaceae bacterium]